MEIKHFIAHSAVQLSKIVNILSKKISLSLLWCIGKAFKFCEFRRFMYMNWMKSLILYRHYF